MAKNKFGMTPLHFTPWVLNADKLDPKEIAELDTGKAIVAAYLIKEHGANVSEPDNFGKSPFDYANGMKEILPKVYEVIKAAKDIQNIIATMPQNPTLEELFEFGNTPQGQQVDLLGWQKAIDIIDEYAKLANQNKIQLVQIS